MNDTGLLVLHALTGVFFVTAGYRKVFNAETHREVTLLFDGYGVPRVAQWAVMLGELYGGLGLLFGCLTHLAALGLLVIVIGAYKLDTWPSVIKKQPQYIGYGHRLTWAKIDKGQLLSNALCTPEAQLIVILTTLALTGAGRYSLDGLLF